MRTTTVGATLTVDGRNVPVQVILTARLEPHDSLDRRFPRNKPLAVTRARASL